MSIPNPFSPVCGTLGGRLPYLPSDIPCRAAVIDGVWDDKLASTGDNGTLYDASRNRYLYPASAAVLSDTVAVVAVSVASDYVGAAYGTDGRPVAGVYVRGGVFTKNKEEWWAADSRSNKNSYANVETRELLSVVNGTLNRIFPGKVGTSIAVPDRALHILVDRDTFALLFFNRALSHAEVLELITYINSKK